MARKPPERVAVYPGSFDPPTFGHLDIIRRAVPLFDRLVVGVLDNPAKRAFLDKATRVALLEGEVRALGVGGVEVRPFAGLTVDFAASVGASWIVRGVRSGTDLADESSMAETNRRAAPGGALETLLLPARSEIAFIKSRLVREIAGAGGDVGTFVPPAVREALEKKRSERT